MPSKIQAGRGCPECAVSGFKDGEPAVVYLCVHTRSNAAKVGISNQGKSYKERLATHRRHGYKFKADWYFADGGDARDIEKETIDRWRRAPKFDQVEEAPADGRTETVSLECLGLAEIIDRISRLAESK